MKKNRRIRDTDARRLDEGEKSRQRIRNDEFRIRRSRALGRVLRTLYKDRFQNSLDRAFVPFSISTANATYTSFPCYLSFSLYFFFYSSSSSLLSEYIFILFSCVNTSPIFFLHLSFFFTVFSPFDFPTFFFSCLSCFSSSSIITSTFLLENGTTRHTRASAESSSARERENGNDRKNGQRCERSWMCKWACVGVWKREGKKRETRRSLDCPDALFGAVSLGESSRATIRANSNWRCLTWRKKKHRPEWRHGSARERRVCVAQLLYSLHEKGEQYQRAQGLDQGRAQPRRRIVSRRQSERREESSLLLSANSFLLKPQSGHERRIYGLSGPRVSNLGTW